MYSCHHCTNALSVNKWDNVWGKKYSFKKLDKKIQNFSGTLCESAWIQSTDQKSCYWKSLVSRSAVIL